MISKSGERVAPRFAVGICPFFAIGRADLLDFCLIQSRPALYERGKALPPIVARSRFHSRVVVEIAQVNRSSFPEGHLCRYFAIAVTDALTVLFEKFRELGLRHAEM